MGARKKLTPVSEIDAAKDAIVAVLARLEITLGDLRKAKITDIAFDGIGNATRGVNAVGSYVAAIRGAIDDPNCEKRYVPEPAKKRGA